MNKIRALAVIHNSSNNNNNSEIKTKFSTKMSTVRSSQILEVGANTSRNSNNNKLTMIIIKAGWPVGGIRRSVKCSVINMRTSSTIHSTKVKIITIMTKMVLIMLAKETMKVQGFRLMLHKLTIRALQRIS